MYEVLVDILLYVQQHKGKAIELERATSKPRNLISANLDNLEMRLNEVQESVWTINHKLEALELRLSHVGYSMSQVLKPCVQSISQAESMDNDEKEDEIWKLANWKKKN